MSADSPALLLARHNYESAYIRRLLYGKEIRRSLEIGCGYGRLSPVFAEFSAEHTAIDINTDALVMARRTYPRYGFLEASATDLPFPHSQFDLVATWTVLQHVPPDRIGVACAELCRVLAPGGILLICEATRFANQPLPRGAHTRDRHVEHYKELLAPLQPMYSSDIAEISRLPGMESPGTVMVWFRGDRLRTGDAEPRALHQT